MPLALALIFVFLYFTFHSAREAALIYTAIPMSAIGGVFALLFRGMPFSISAGVGFIALFGVAVLNGIVLVSTFNQLQKEGMNDLVQRVIEGTRLRLRPVLMTATVASLGFIPMALSRGAGAEVQKPLATVVIGGLATATLLTLVVLPCLYIIFSGKRGEGSKKAAIVASILCLLFLANVTQAQQRITINAAIDSALKSNQQLAINQSEISKADYNAKTARDIPKTGVFAENEDLSPSDNSGILKIGISQDIAYPGLYKARKNYLNRQLEYYQLNTSALNAAIRRDVSAVYYELWYLQDKQLLFQRLDSIYTSLYKAAELRVKTGESAGLDKIAANAKMKELQAMLQQNNKEITVQRQQLMMLLNNNDQLSAVEGPLEKLSLTIAPNENPHPLLNLQQQNI
ncbi:MAG TPA: efflux RND transporter permease subunit, partial [Chitinophagaceae bacterium]|nr:efflux RND transporter permease subunit [Chitinophagaceae bacterium]